MIAIDTPDWVRLRTLVETGLEDLFARHASPLWEAMAYGTLGGGKRVRGMLALAAAEAVGQAPEKALPAAMALELVHAFSLVHDDLPALDDSPERRGKPSCHVAHGEAVALLAGDALLALAFECLVPTGDMAMVGELAAATGAEGMCGGQVLDLAGSTDIETLHRLKTGALFRAALRLGALAANATAGQLTDLTEVGEKIGLAFQIVDDLLDYGDDQGPSYANRFGPEAARAMAEREVADALAILADWPETAASLRALCRMVTERKS